MKMKFGSIVATLLCALSATAFDCADMNSNALAQYHKAIAKSLENYQEALVQIASDADLSRQQEGRDYAYCLRNIEAVKIDARTTREANLIVLENIMKTRDCYTTYVRRHDIVHELVLKQVAVQSALYYERALQAKIEYDRAIQKCR